jgi:NAD(P)-dependent dehydrogenase (short-subunit alcohol dehydrogenase family)
MENNLAGKVVLITGAGKGSGWKLAELFAARGAVVAVNDLTPLNVDRLVMKICDSGGKAKAYMHDVAKKVDVQAMVNDVTDDWGRIDIFVHHAAVEPHDPILDMDEWDWHRTLDVNLTGAFLTIQSVGRVMRIQGGGTIVLLVDRARQSGQGAAYAASQEGLLGLAGQAHQELAAHGIHLHVVSIHVDHPDPAEREVPNNPLDTVLYLCNKLPKS